MNIISNYILTYKDKEHIIKDFYILDKDGDGEISKEELIKGCG